MAITRSTEDYLETILILGEHVHAVDISLRLNVSKAAVTKAVKNLLERGYVSVDKHHICLTAEGRKYAEGVYEKHGIISKFLIKLGVDEASAERDACLMEHMLSEQTFAAIKNFIEEK